MGVTITTVIPTFRRSALLRRAIESVLAQSYRDLVVRVYDNASGDDTARVVADIAARDPRVSYVERPENLGAAENFVQAFGDIVTPLCSFLSDDDYVLPGFFDKAAAALTSHPQVAMFAGSTLEHDDAGDLRYAPLLSWPREGVYRPDESVIQMLDYKHPTWTGIIFRTDALRAAGGLDRGASAALDADAELRVAARSPIIISFAPCAVYTAHDDTVSAGQTAAVIPSYERILANIEAVSTLPAGVRARFAARLQRQLRMKLVEISVKAQVRGQREVARDAAQQLRDRYGPRWLGVVLCAALWTCVHVSPAQALLAWLEARRVQRRAQRARRQVASQRPLLRPD